ncbi:MAG: S-layer homology domain-containing protein, partial [Acidimicrobiia bacterium]|nr:S-layer homology domain-containing protein [Acidimicrobiia bacterium]
ALRAQAIAGRTYGAYRLLGNEQPALATADDAGLSDNRKAACWCHIYSTVRDQSYVAYAKEGQPGSSGGARWVSAVNATAGRVVTHPTATSVHSTIVLAFYHSSSGGITETNTTVWGTSPQPYLQSVDDGWSNSSAVNNPFESWTATFTAAELATELEWDEVTNVTLVNGPPGASFTFTGRDGGASITDNVTAATLYAALGTRSPHIDSVTLDAFYPFVDMEGTVHTDAIFRIWEEGITFGCGGEFFCPESELTRAQMATFLARTLDLEPIDDARFSDVEATSVHAPNINAVAEAGISVGCNAQGTNFCPEDTVSRAQMASFLVRALELNPVSEGPFVDLAGAAGHQENINALWQAGVTNGCAGDGTLYCPTEPVTRAQMASFLVRAFLS